MSGLVEENELMLVELLHFGPLMLIDDIINTVNNVNYAAVKGLEKVYEGLDTRMMPSEELEQGIVMLETLLENAADRNFDAVELYVLRNILTVPTELASHVVMKHHQGLDFSKDDFAELDEELLKAQKILSASMQVKREIARQQALMKKKIERLSKQSTQLAFIKQEASMQQGENLKDPALPVALINL